MTLNDSQVADKYELTFHYNVLVHVPGIYRGKLKDINLKAADLLFAKGSNLLKLKTKPGSTVPYQSGIEE
jgi:hypothetical protein